MELKRAIVSTKNGFLLVELLFGLLISTLFIVIITHYIIEAKNAQQKALHIIESFSTARNEKEKSFLPISK